MACSDEDRGGSRELNAEDQGGCTCRILGGRAVEMSGGVVCSLHRTRGDEESRFIG
jgi:hypothetical protein